MKPPSYRLQKPNRAFVEFDGERIYLGRFGSPESKARYHQKLAEWNANGGRLPIPQSDITTVELCLLFDLHAQRHYPPGSNEITHYKTVANAIIALYGREPVSLFGPLKLKAVRSSLMQSPDQRGKKTGKRSRQYINSLVARAKRIFRWGVGEELVPAAVLTALEAVTGLQAGRCEAPEAEPTTPVPDSIIDATVKHLPPTVAAMVRLQRRTGMRSGELCIMRTCDIDTSGTEWKYTPQRHKLSWRGKSRTIYIGKRGQEVLRTCLRSEVEAYIFSPAQADAERREQRHKERKTPPNEGNTVGSNRQRNPRKSPGDRYCPQSYARAVQYACKLAFPNDPACWWRPGQLRHTFATEARSNEGLDAAQALLGHSKITMSQHYAVVDEAKAIQAIRRIG